MHSKTWGYTQRCENGHPIEDGNKEYKSHFWFRKSQSENGGGGFVGEVAFLGFPQDTTLNGNENPTPSADFLLYSDGLRRAD